MIHEDVLLDADAPKACPACGGEVTCLLGPLVPAGILPGRPRQSSQLGREFTSNAEERDWHAANPNVVAIAKGSADDRALGDKLRENSERLSRRQGFRDHDDKQVFLRKQRDDRARHGLTGGGRRG
jgi:hypothetical protein